MSDYMWCIVRVELRVCDTATGSVPTNNILHMARYKFYIVCIVRDIEIQHSSIVPATVRVTNGH